ncbi:hypothetical protein H0H93_014025 [Arthromyces matolae]|nr:hypothetical protein H0H93_014025 [Arthromyces matolae]
MALSVDTNVHENSASQSTSHNSIPSGESGTAPGPHVGPTSQSTAASRPVAGTPSRKSSDSSSSILSATIPQPNHDPSKQPRGLEEREDIRTHGSQELHRRTMDYILSAEGQDDTDGHRNLAYSQLDFDNTHDVYVKKRTEVALDTRHYDIDAID